MKIIMKQLIVTFEESTAAEEIDAFENYMCAYHEDGAHQDCKFVIQSGISEVDDDQTTEG